MGNFNKTTQMAFRAGIDRRQAAAHANDTWAVYSVKKNGNLYAKPNSTHKDEASAIAEMTRIQALNPTMKFAVRPI